MKRIKRRWVRLYYENGFPLMGAFTIRRVSFEVNTVETVTSYANHLASMRKRSSHGIKVDRDRPIYFKLIAGEDISHPLRIESEMILIQ